MSIIKTSRGEKEKFSTSEINTSQNANRTQQKSGCVETHATLCTQRRPSAPAEGARCANSRCRSMVTRFRNSLTKTDCWPTIPEENQRNNDVKHNYQHQNQHRIGIYLPVASVRQESQKMASKVIAQMIMYVQQVTSRNCSPGTVELTFPFPHLYRFEQTRNCDILACLLVSLSASIT